MIVEVKWNHEKKRKLAQHFTHLTCWVCVRLVSTQEIMTRTLEASEWLSFKRWGLENKGKWLMTVYSVHFFQLISPSSKNPLGLVIGAVQWQPQHIWANKAVKPAWYVNHQGQWRTSWRLGDESLTWVSTKKGVLYKYVCQGKGVLPFYFQQVHVCVHTCAHTLTHK